MYDGVFNFLRVDEHFEKPRFCVGLVWTLRVKIVFSDFPGVKWTGPKVRNGKHVFRSAFPI